MRFMQWAKDGGPNSPVDAFYFIEIKSLFSVMLLKFNPGQRETYHSHAFNAYSFWLAGHPVEQALIEDTKNGGLFPRSSAYCPGTFKYSPRSLIHRYWTGAKGAWALTFRGPWAKTWKEYKQINGNDYNFDWEVTTLKSPDREVVSKEYV